MANRVKLYLIRHGHAASGFGEDLDPGLDELGHAQAAQMAVNMTLELNSDQSAAMPFAMIVSPLRRTRETAQPLEQRWGAAARVESRIAELPSPDGLSLADRLVWLREILPGSWASMPEELQKWRDNLIAALLECREDTVAVTHFVAINVALSFAAGTDNIMTAQPANCSITCMESDGQNLFLKRLGSEAEIEIR